MASKPKPESVFLNSVRSKLPKTVYCMKTNNPFIAGIPDLWVSGNKADLWAEGKWMKKLPTVLNLRTGKKPMLSVLQQEWLRERHREGRHVAVIVGSPDGCVVMDGIEWDKPCATNKKITRQELADWITKQTMN